ncbi:glycosyltransferase family 4 protein [Pedobacter punctiformis]|uniref:Glycosyltransferase family 4 protein n=1 Tax=Pedobacter punctiformis TaxID=3004097 RepID=A0ABT4L9S9_9SPHI|nr:glycosyltransferase family 4 protein [Pedobacter sp. HCMS5-2]MCZ4244692.1 glycosyltransferase family 4 protein [Pedobacter sp. HCMS5-2]
MRIKGAKILFLTLNTFSLTGGIEKVNRTFSKVLDDLQKTGEVEACTSMSMYDDQPDVRYISANNFKGFNGKRSRFGISALLKGITTDMIILSHINLLIFGKMIKTIHPKKRIILFAHGIEVWSGLPGWKIKFLKQHCEIWAVSNFTSQKLLDYQIPERNIKILNNCLDPYFTPSLSLEKPKNLLAKYNLQSSQPVLFTLSRISSKEQYKGYDQVINALSQVLQKYPDLIYILAGKADDDEKNRIESLIKQHRLEHNVMLTGYLADEEIPEHFNLADIFVMPSKGEGFGISFIEAATSGCAIIGGNKDGSTDALLNGELGTLVDPDHLPELENAIFDLLEKPKPANYSELQQLKCLNNFGYEKYKENVSNLLFNRHLNAS